MSQSKFRAEGRRRARAAAALARRAEPLGSVVAPLAFARDPESRHAIDGNPNRAKFHASRAGLNLADPASAQRERMSRNQGRRARGETSRTPYLETSNARIPALGSTISKRVPRS